MTALRETDTNGQQIHEEILASHEEMQIKSTLENPILEKCSFLNYCSITLYEYIYRLVLILYDNCFVFNLNNILRNTATQGFLLVVYLRYSSLCN